MSFKPSQSTNAWWPIFATFFEIVTFVRLLQQANERYGTDVIPAGIVTLVRLLQFSNAPSPIVVMLLGISYAPSFDVRQHNNFVFSLLKSTPSSNKKF